MKLNALALGAVMGVSITSSIAPAMATTQSRPTITPIYCDLCDDFSQTGGYSRFVNTSNQRLIVFGEADTLCPATYVGARIDAPGFPANNWLIRINAPSGNPIFATELVDRYGCRYFTNSFSTRVANSGNIRVTLTPSDVGFSPSCYNFASIFVYDAGLGGTGGSFRDFMDYGNGIQVDGRFPTANFTSIQSDCSGIFGTLN
jgi:hypothetical protein